MSPANESGTTTTATTVGRKWFPSNILGGHAVEAVNDNSMVDNDDSNNTEEGVEVQEDLALDDRNLPLAFKSLRYVEPVFFDEQDEAAQSWRMRERMKTVSVALVICLNVGVDPPDVKKTEPCARTECWILPMTLNPQRALEAIGNNLQKQYERWQPRARYRQSLDPTIEEVRRLATGLRRNARDERVLFHYNGHGVPKPTANGEIWVFNRSYTQYIPLSLFDLQSWMGSPSIFVYDCSNAGIIVSSFEQFAEQHEREYHEQVAAQGVSSTDLPTPISPRNCIQLAACSSTQLLPMNPELPADLFTACLTTPIKMALRWFVMQNQGKLAPRTTIDMLDKIPGQFGDRRTMLGELNWIFTAITDTIAWNTLPRSLFEKLFRQDMLVASLFRNFLLAERVMRSYDCTPVSSPPLPHTHQHPMWQAWDLAVDISLSQLPGILEKGQTYRASTFFEEQLTAFEVWLKYGDESRPPPEQLPIVLQVLLSQAHRLRALDLLGRFLDLGPWAVNLALSVGIFPYVLRLLQASARELRPLLVSIWAKILSVDTSCQADLIRDSSHRYFLSVLQDDCMMPNHRTWAAFILASIVHNYRQGQQEAEQGNLIAICLEHLRDQEPVLRQWLAIAVGRVWDHYEPARWRGARDNAHEKLYELLKDPVPEVRAAAVFALGTFINSCEERTEHANSLDHSIALHLLKTVVEDGSPIVRQELVVALQHFTLAFDSNLVNVCRANMNQENTTAETNILMTSSTKSPLNRRMQSSTSSPSLDRLGAVSKTNSTGSLYTMASALPGIGSVYDKVYKALEYLTRDPHPVVNEMAHSVVTYLKTKVKNRELARPPTANSVPNNKSPLDTASASMPNSPAKQPSYISRRQPYSSTNTIQEEENEDAGAASVTSEPSKPALSTKQRHASGHQPSSSSSSHLHTPGVRPPELSTEFINWSSKYFTKRLMRHECVDCDCDHESWRHWTREWTYSRNASVRAQSERQVAMLKSRTATKLDANVHTLPGSPVMRVSPHTTTAVVFHPYEGTMVSAGHNVFDVFEVANGQSGKLNHFEASKGRVKANFASLQLINAHEDAVLCATADNGSVMLFRDFGNPDKVKLVAAWNGLRDLEQRTQHRGYNHYHTINSSNNQYTNSKASSATTAWNQTNLTLAVAVDRNIRLWDAHKEMKWLDLDPEDVHSPVTRLNFAPYASNISGVLAAAYQSGTVKLFDPRNAFGGRMAVLNVHALDGHPVLDVQLQDHSPQPLLVAGCSDGRIKVYDVRKPYSISGSGPNYIDYIGLGYSVTRMAIHARCGLVAAWTPQQTVTVASFDPVLGLSPMNVIKHHEEGVLGVRLGTTEAGTLAFHPFLLQLAVASKEGAMSIKAIRN